MLACGYDNDGRTSGGRSSGKNGCSMGLVYLRIRPWTCSVSRSNHSSKEHFADLPSVTSRCATGKAACLQDVHLLSSVLDSKSMLSGETVQHLHCKTCENRCNGCFKQADNGLTQACLLPH